MFNEIEIKVLTKQDLPYYNLPRSIIFNAKHNCMVLMNLSYFTLLEIAAVHKIYSCL